MMQFRMVLASLGALGVSGCNPWFDYAPKSVGEEVVAVTQSGVDDPPSDRCPAKDLQYLVGQPRTVLETMRFGSEMRIEGQSQAYTLEFIPTRTRIIVGSRDKIISVVCG
jgi:Peptidase inhibitor I78 family